MEQSDSELKERIESHSRREDRFAYIVFGALLFEAVVTWCFSDGKGFMETFLIIGADILIALGVLGEIREAAVVRRASDELSRRADHRVADTHASAAAANERASQAMERAGQLEKDAAASRLELEKLKEKQLPRTLSAEQTAKIKASIAARKITGKIAVKFNFLDMEAAVYAGQIEAALKAGGANVIDLPNAGIIATPDAGGYVLMMDMQNAPLHAVEVQNVLLDAGITFPGYAWPASNFPRDLVVIWVSHK